MPDADRLLDALLGPRGSADRPRLETHVKRCLSCQQAIEAFAGMLPELTDDDLRRLGREWRAGVGGELTTGR